MIWPKNVLMVTPTYFDVQYSINPHMLDESGNLNQIDHKKAFEQWENLQHTFESLSINVEILDGQVNLPDMVFSANQTFPFIKNNKTHFILSKMESQFRAPEVPFFQNWATQNKFITHTLDLGPFEGMGDALWDYEKNRVIAGFGFRSSLDVYNKIEKIIETEIITLELKNDQFYHLDTCLSIFGNDTAAYVPEAFNIKDIDILKSLYRNLIAITVDEATTHFAANMCTPNGKDIIIQKGPKNIISKLLSEGFNIIEIDTSEFIKAGGSVFCMKLLF